MPHARTGTRAAPRRVRYIWPVGSTCDKCHCTDYVTKGHANAAPRRYRECTKCHHVYVVRATHEEIDDGGRTSQIRPIDKYT